MEIWTLFSQLDGMREWDIWPIWRQSRAGSLNTTLQSLVVYRQIVVPRETDLFGIPFSLVGLPKGASEPCRAGFLRQFHRQPSVLESDRHSLGSAAALQGGTVDIVSSACVATGRRGSAHLSFLQSASTTTTLPDFLNHPCQALDTLAKHSSMEEISCTLMYQ